jgi:hypothetical protein
VEFRNSVTNIALVILPSSYDVQYVLEIPVISHKIYVQLNDGFVPPKLM